MKVIYSDHALATEQVRTLERKPWMRESYFKRVNKKWLKRFGTKEVPAMYEAPEALIVHPVFRADIERITQPKPPPSHSGFSLGYKSGYGPGNIPYGF